MHSFIAIVCCKLTYRVQVDGLGGGGTIVGGVTNFFFFFFCHLKVIFYQVMLVCHTSQYKCVLGGGGAE